MTFIQKIANYIVEKEIELQNLTIILPSERAKKYLLNALIKKYNRPIIAPEVVTMDRWVKSFSDESVIDQTRAIIKLFELQLAEAKTEEDRSFDEFLTWGNILYSDFNEIDRYLLDANDVFRNLRDIKEIEQWSFGNEELTDSQKRFMEFWDRLPGYYSALNSKLSSQNSCYAGKAYKQLSQNIDLLFKGNNKRQFIFAGFNALSKAEKSIIKQLERLGRAHVLIDADEYYYSNPAHEAGQFLRDLQVDLGGKKLDFITNSLKTKPIKIELVECAQNTGQVKVAASILESFTKEEIDETLLLLADESLIGSLLKNLPKKIGKANITLGLPIRTTAARTWVELLFSIQENKKRFNTQAIYFNDLQNFWNHPFVLAVLSKDEKKTLHKVEQSVIKYNQIFLTPSKLELGEVSKKILELITLDWEMNWVIAINTIRELNSFLFAKLNSEFAFEKAILECFDASLVDFQNIVEEGIPIMTLKSFGHLFNQHWGMKSIAYHGNPLDGLQIMGLLETRALDFKRIVCIGMNEGNLPPTNTIQTLIPMDLRRYLGLPTPREKQGLFAHHFYRLLHACEELHVTYSTADESIGSNEPSRYLMQLEMELSRINENAIITKKIYSLESSREKLVKAIEKTDEVKFRIDELLAKSTSASMLKTYLTCPLDFYFKYVMDFGEEDSVEEEIEHSTFGTFIHNTLEILYQPFARHDSEGEKVSPAPPNITSQDIEAMLGRYKLVMHQQFMEHFNNNKDSFMKGKNLLSYKMSLELTEKFLLSEIKFISKQTQPVFIEALEQTFEKTVDIPVGNQVKKVNFRGIIDRIDSIGEKIRIVDYKSGKVNDIDVQFRVKDTEEEAIVETLAKRKHVLQLILYAFLYYQKHKIVPESNIISFVSGNNEPFKLDTKNVDLSQVIEDFPDYIGKILEDMYDEEIPFEHDSSQYFSYCNYCE